ncbi:hypothetical protein [Flavisolibacter tropicus]|uniref:Uncharacterized protein n=1 Tax=Flavisolibacter tropicus TaxID=1492898 RepID=A0A172TVI6_9BACT|nr:hypothetical protein [Flavisolibacter tropicus]ANE51012.1 hypothetical protein SY85_11360 [Flavisolibacter tropicus]
MGIKRCSEQKRQTLEEFYAEFIPDKVKTFADVGTPMLKVLNLLNDTFPETEIYGLTSHATLLLLSEDSSLSPWFVAINGLEDEYYIEYLMTPDKEPWPNARVKGATKSLNELQQFIIIAMKESAGWSNSIELQRLYSDIKDAKH